MGVLSVLLIILLILAALLASKQFFGRKEKNETEASLDDEFIYDSVSGKRITIEEAENGVDMTEDPAWRIKSDKEIEDNYDEQGREVEYIYREALQRNLPEIEDERVIRIIEGSDVWHDTGGGQVMTLWTSNYQNYVGLANVTPAHPTVGGFTHDRHLTGIVQGAALQKEISALNDCVTQQIEDFLIFRITHVAKFSEFQTVLALFEAERK